MNLLAKVFEYFKVPLKDEKCIKVVDIVMTKAKLEALKFKTTSFRQWSHEKEHTEKSTFS